MKDSDPSLTLGTKAAPAQSAETQETPEAYSARLGQAFVNNLKRNAVAEHEADLAKLPAHIRATKTPEEWLKTSGLEIMKLARDWDAAGHFRTVAQSALNRRLRGLPPIMESCKGEMAQIPTPSQPPTPDSPVASRSKLNMDEYLKRANAEILRRNPPKK